MDQEDFSFYHHIAILLLGGAGTRFGSSKPKQFLPMAGQPLCLYGARALEESPSVDFIVYVIPKGYERNFALLLGSVGHKKPSVTISGGISRQESGHVAIAYLQAQGVNKDAIVLLQDGDRPRLKQRYLQENFKAAEKYGASVTAIKANDSVAISKVDHLLDGYIPRNEVYLLQTPQAFRFELIASAMEMAAEAQKQYTDDGSLLLAMKGVNPYIVEGDKNNIKITTPEDQEEFEEGEK
jgi:2-C-methyl-D-erythritol 4-phosphate cytidylyltransferase